MNQNELDGLLALKMVAEKRNFTLAAAELGISPPAISKTIKQLEKRLGITLLSRTTRSTSLTEAGQRFLNEAGPALDQILAAMKNASSFSTNPSGLLRINLPKAAFHPHIEPLLKSFLKKYPEISIELYFEDHASDVVRSGFDAGIRISDILAKDMVAVKLFGPIRFVVAGSKKYFEKQRRPKHPKDLLAHQCILSRFGNGIYDRWEFESKGKEFQVHVKGGLILNDPIILQEAAMSGLGLIYMAEDSIQEKINQGKLEVVLDNYVVSSAGYYLYYPQISQVQPKLRAFINHIKENSKKN